MKTKLFNQSENIDRMILHWHRILGVSFCTLLVIFATEISARELPQATAEPLVAQRPDDRSPVRVVIRFSEQLFQTPRRAEIDEVTPVSERINGVLNVGTAHTVGNLAPDFQAKRNGLAMTLIFSGRTTSRTVGRKGMAQIVDRTASDFRVEIPMEFDLEHGFSSGDPTAEATIVRSCKDVRARKAGLLAPLVRAVALKRMKNQSSEIRRESETLTEQRMIEASEARVEQRLNAWNDRWLSILTLLRTQPWYQGEAPIRLSTTEEDLILTIDPRVLRTQAVGRKPEVELTPELPERPSSSLLDVIVYDDDRAVSNAAAILKLVEQIIEPESEHLWQIERVTFETSQGEGWVMFSTLGVEPEVAQSCESEK